MAFRPELADFGDFYERTYQVAYRTALGIVRDPALAADVTQDAYVAAYGQRDRFRGEAPGRLAPPDRGQPGAWRARAGGRRVQEVTDLTPLMVPTTLQGLPRTAGRCSRPSTSFPHATGRRSCSATTTTTTTRRSHGSSGHVDDERRRDAHRARSIGCASSSRLIPSRWPGRADRCPANTISTATSRASSGTSSTASPARSTALGRVAGGASGRPARPAGPVG